jgi:hypothetical protein
MCQVTRGKIKTIIPALEKQLTVSQIHHQFRVTTINGVDTAFYIDVLTDITNPDIKSVVKAMCSQRNWEIIMDRTIDVVIEPIKPIIPPPRKRISSPVNQDVSQKIITILSNHRSPIDQSKPLTLTKKQILSLLESSLSPDYPQDRLSQELESSLRELEAKGEIYAGVGNRFCIAQPTVLYEEALFIGDRVYLPLAHQALGNPAVETNKLVFPDLSFEVLQHKFSERGISLITIEQSLQYLPEPSLPLTQMLSGYEVENPFINPDYAGILHYVPQWGEQSDRWREPSRSTIRNPDLLRLPTGEYLWYKQEVFYQIEKDAAILAMFKLDQKDGQTIRVVWDSDRGHLDLKNVNLPSSYAQCLWRLSSPTDNDNRVRYVEPNRRNYIEEILRRLGCQTV